MTIDQIYEQTIQPLPAADRLRLATLILEGISPQSIVDYGDEWSEEDLREFSRATWNRADTVSDSGDA